MQLQYIRIDEVDKQEISYENGGAIDASNCISIY